MGLVATIWSPGLPRAEYSVLLAFQRRRRTRWAARAAHADWLRARSHSPAPV